MGDRKLIRHLGIAATVVVFGWIGCGDDEDDNPGSVGSAGLSSTGQGGHGVGGEGGNGGDGGGGGGGGINPTSATCAPPAGDVGRLRATAIGSGFSSPMLLAAPWGDDERLFVIERAGRVLLLKDGARSLFLDISSKVMTGGERGLLGIAFHPDYAQNGRFFLHYSGSGEPSPGRTVIEEYRRDPDDADKASPEPIGPPFLVVPQPASNHNGGSIEFSPADRFLYIALGDGGGGGDTYGTGQNQSSLLAKLLRIDVSANPYSIPPGNMAGGMPEVFHMGLRNPFRIGFDICTGDLYIGDVGQGSREEVDIAAAGVGSINWGWSIMEGSECFQASTCASDGLAPPAAEYDHGGGKCSISGGQVYRGANIPWLRGAYLYGDYCTGQVWMLRWQNGDVSDQRELTAELGALGHIVGFGRDNRGELYIVTIGGTIYRIDPE